MTQSIRYAARSDVGLLREGNEDSGYASPRLLAVADGMGGHVGGEIASAAAIEAIRTLDADVPAADLLAALEQAVKQANEHLHRIVEADPALQGMGTTLTAMLWAGDQMALVHIGDSRAYLLRNGELFQITHDHTLVQQLVDEGRITPDEAATHPQRSLLLRALDGRNEIDPDLKLRPAMLGDRYLLCSDGLSGVVSAETMHQVLSSVADPDQAVRDLIDLANRGGGPDNITCVVADVIDVPQQQPTPPSVVGAAASGPRTAHPNGSPPLAGGTPAERAAQLPLQAPRQQPPPEDTLPEMQAVQGRPRRRWTWLVVALVLFVLLLAGVGVVGWNITRGSYYIAENNGQVVIYQGVDGSVLGFDLSSVKEKSNPPLAKGDLTQADQAIVAKKDQGLSDFKAAQNAVKEMRERSCKYTLRPAGNNVQLQQGVAKNGQPQQGCQAREIPLSQPIKFNKVPTRLQGELRSVFVFDNLNAANTKVQELSAAAKSCEASPKQNGCPKESSTPS